MVKNHELDRRTFLKNSGMTALVGAVGAGISPALLAGDSAPSSKYDLDTPYDRVGSDCVKWDQQIKTYGRENIAVGMGIADMDFRAAPCITKALQERMKHENWGYLDTPRSYIDAIVNWNKRRYGVDINPDLLVLSNGVHPALIAALKTFSPPGSRVLLTTPVYDGFYGDLSFCQLKAEESLLKAVDGRFSIDFDDLERRISHETNTLILCNPHNPTGNCWSPEDLTRIGEICLRRRVVVLADEIHCDFVSRGNKYTPFASLPDKKIVSNSITFKAASKSFSLSAMKAAWFFSDNRDYIARIKANNHLDLNTLAMVANRSALTDGEEWLDQVVAYIDGNHDFVESVIKARVPLVKYVKAQGTYLAWLDVNELINKIDAGQQAAKLSDESHSRVTPEVVVQRYLVNKARVHLSAGSAYGSGGAGHMRMNIATSRRTLELALDNLAHALTAT
jgi:cystathionine beta-lyase